MNKLIKIKNGRIKSVYSDEIFHILKMIGTPVVKRATQLDYNNSKKKWIGRLVNMGNDNVGIPSTIICSDNNKNKAVEKEVKFLNKNL